MSDKKQTAFRISEGLLKRLKVEAKKQNRSINNLVEVLIDKHVPSVAGSISVDELISEGYEESYYEWYRCPKCNKKGLSDKDNYCSCCGVKILNI